MTSTGFRGLPGLRAFAGLRSESAPRVHRVSVVFPAG